MKGGMFQGLKGLLQGLGKLKYPLLVLLLGILLLLIPGKKEDVQKGETIAPEPTLGKSTLALEEARLARLLSRVEGAGQVEVMLSLSSGQETVYQTDTQIIREEDGRTQEQSNTFLYQADGDSRLPLVCRELSPVYRGALILCQGGDDPVVRLALIQAVAGLTGLGSDRITVVKMK